MNPSNKQDLIFTLVMLIVLGIVVFTDAPAGETCTQYGNRLECYTDDGQYREEYQFGNRTEKWNDDGGYEECYQYGNTQQCY